MAYSTPVFVETNLGTRIVVPIPPHISVKDFKGEFERVHLNCFPGYGSIKIDTMMVKRRSCYYYLPESLPLKYAFQDSNGNCFLRILVHMPTMDNQTDCFNCNGSEVFSHNSIDGGVTDELGCSLSSGDKNIIKHERKKSKVFITPYYKSSLVKMPVFLHLWRKRKKGRKSNRRGTIKSQSFGYKSQPRIAKGVVARAEAHRRKKWDSTEAAVAFSQALSETVSVSGIIHKYFSDYDEVASSSRFSFAPVLGTQIERLNSSKGSKYSNIQPDLLSPLVANKPTLENHNSRERSRKTEVGKRLVLASNSLGLTPSTERPALSVCKFSDKRRLDDRFVSMMRTLVFEIPDDDD